MAGSTASKGPNGGLNGWVEYRRLVLAELERISTEVTKLTQSGNIMQLAFNQNLAEVRSNLLDKIREATHKLDDDYQRVIDAMEKELNSKLQDNSDKSKIEFKNLIEDIDKHDKDIAAFKSKAAMLGAAAGFLVALAGLLANLFLKH